MPGCFSMVVLNMLNTKGAGAFSAADHASECRLTTHYLVNMHIELRKHWYAAAAKFEACMYSMHLLANAYTTKHCNQPHEENVQKVSFQQYSLAKTYMRADRLQVSVSLQWMMPSGTAALGLLPAEPCPDWAGCHPLKLTEPLYSQSLPCSTVW